MASRRRKRRHRARSRSWIPASLTALMLVGGYVAADLADLVPGPLTLTGDWPDAEPFPEPVFPVAQNTLSLDLDPTAPIPDAEQVDALVQEFLDDPGVGPSPALLIQDALTGAVLADVAGSEPRVPASTTKLLTAVAVLDAAGEGFRFTTTAVAGAQDDADAVTVIAGGDLTLAADAGDEFTVIGRGGIGDLAEQVAQQLHAQERGQITDVVIDESIWSGPRTAPRWDQSDFDGGWIIPMSPIAIDLGKQMAGGARSMTPATDAGAAFKDALEAEGIEVSGEIRIGTAAPGGEELGAVHSAPLAELVEYMLVYSDNVLAESLGRLAAVESGLPGSFDGAEEAIGQRLANLGVDTTGLVLADNSGVSSVNKISARTLVGTMGAINHGHPELLATVRGLPIAGLEGTLRNRMRETPAAGVVTAKTGSLSSAATIAGQVHTQQGRLLHVAIMTSDFEHSLAGARGAIDRLLVGLAECGCE